MGFEENTSMTSETHPYLVVCDDNIECGWRTAHTTALKATNAYETHKNGNCPQTKVRAYLLPDVDERGQQYTAPHMGKSLNEKLWDALDVYLSKVMKGESVFSDSDTFQQARGKCQGLAYSIHLMSAHHYPTPDDVTRQAVKRYKMKQGTIEYEPTPGYMFNPPPPDSKAARDYRNRHGSIDAPKATKKAAPKKAAAPALKTEEVNAIKVAYASGLMTKSSLANTYNLTEDALDALLST